MKNPSSKRKAKTTSEKAGNQIWRGMFSLTEADRRTIRRWQANREIEQNWSAT